jgi:hypothetical protein
MHSHLPISGSLSEFDFAAILARMHAQALDGQLKITLARSTKTLWLQDGCIVFAQSSLADDSLGHFLLQRGIITAAQLEKSRERMKRKKCRQGRALLEMELLSPEQLWSEVAAQLRAIVFSLFPLRAGRYDIGRLGENGGENIMLALPVATAILEGVRQIGDKEFIESRFEAGMTLFHSAERGIGAVALKPHEAHVLSLVADATPVDEIVSRSELLRFDTLKVLYSLLRLELICDRKQTSRAPTPHALPNPPTTFTSFDEVLQHYNAKFETIYRVLSKEIGPVAHSILTDAITSVLESIPPCFQALAIRPDGRIDEKSVMKSVWYENFADNSGEFLRGLEEILYAEIYAVKRHLGKEHEASILKWIRNSGN